MSVEPLTIDPPASSSGRYIVTPEEAEFADQITTAFLQALKYGSDNGTDSGTQPWPTGGGASGRMDPTPMDVSQPTIQNTYRTFFAVFKNLTAPISRLGPFFDTNIPDSGVLNDYFDYGAAGAEQGLTILSDGELKQLAINFPTTRTLSAGSMTITVEKITPPSLTIVTSVAFTYNTAGEFCHRYDFTAGSFPVVKGDVLRVRWQTDGSWSLASTGTASAVVDILQTVTPPPAP